MRAVITGIGVVSPFGIGRDRFWSCARGGCSAARRIPEFEAAGLPCQVAAPLPELSADDVPAVLGEPPEGADRRGDPRRYSRASLAAVIAVREAWTDAGLRWGEPGAGVIIGSGAGGIDVGERQYEEFFMQQGKRVTPFAIPVSVVGMIASEISISLNLREFSHVLSTGARARPTRSGTPRG